MFAGFAIFEREVKGVVHYGVHAKADSSVVPLGECFGGFEEATVHMPDRRVGSFGDVAFNV